MLRKDQGNSESEQGFGRRMNEIGRNVTISKKEIVNGMVVRDYFKIKNTWIRITRGNLFIVKSILFLSFRW